MFDILEYRRRGGITIESERLDFVVENDLSGERRLGLSQSLGVHMDFDDGELEIGWNAGRGFPSRCAGTQTAIGRKDDAFTSIR